MRFVEKLLSVLLTFSLAMMSVTAVPVSAVFNERPEKSPVYYNTTNSQKSKDLINTEQPFNVFEIYNAYYGITTAPAVTTTASKITTKTTTAKTTTKVKTTAKTTAPAAVKTTTKAKTTVKTTAPAAVKTTTKAKTTTKTASVPVTTSTEQVISTTETTKTEVSTTTEPIITTAVVTTYLRGIDVSEHQYIIDWQQVADSGMVDYVIIRAGYGKELYQVDKFFAQNIQGAQAAGLDVGLYWFSYAMSVEEAEKEAEVCYEIIKDYSFNYPIYFDIEYERALQTLSNAELSAMVDTFCTYFAEKGYYTGVYSYASCLQSKIYRQVLDKYDVWVAQYNTSVSAYDGHYEMWQYASDGRIPGISTVVDMNQGYRDYAEIIGVNPAGGVLPPKPVTTADPSVVTTAANELITAYTTDETTTTTITTTTQSRTEGRIIDLTVTSAEDLSGFESERFKYAMFAIDSGTPPETIREAIDLAHDSGTDCGILYKASDCSEETVRSNAQALVNTLSSKTLEYPIYYWIEQEDYNSAVDGLVADGAVFCNELENAGYFAGIAAFDNILSFHCDPALLQKYNAGIFNEKGTFIFYPKIMGLVFEYDEDEGEYLSYSTRNFPDIMKYNGLNGYPKIT